MTEEDPKQPEDQLAEERWIDTELDIIEEPIPEESAEQ